MAKQGNFPRNQKKNVGSKIKREQPRKDNRTRRVNFDNERVDKLDKNGKGNNVIPPMCTNKSNDISWYTRNPELLQGAANLNFYNVTGQQIPLYPTLSGSVDPTLITSIPGIMSLLWTPYIGGVDNVAVNQAANDMYSFVVHANSRNTTYDAPDLMMLVLAGASVFSMMALGIRAYGIMQHYNAINKYLPDSLLKAMGFQADDLKANYSHMYYDVSRLIARTKTIWIPKTFPFVSRWFWMNSNIYMDSSTPKGQYYIFTPQTFLVVDETSSDQGTSLNYGEWYPNTLTFTGKTWSVYVAEMDRMIDNLMRMQYRGVIFGDILKAYGADQLFAISSIAEDYKVEPIFDEEVLTQIENATTFTTTPAAIVQDANTVTIETQWPSTTSVNDRYMPNLNLLNFHQSEPPTEAQIVVATRLSVYGNTPIFGSDGKTIVCYAPKYAGTEYISAIRVFGFGYIIKDGVMTEDLLAVDMNNVSEIASPSISKLALWAAFDWAPALYIGVRSNSTVNYLMSDFCNHTYLSQDVMQRLHTMAVYSEFGVPTFV